VAAFVSFINDDLTTLIEPLDILEAKAPADWTDRFKQIAKAKGGGKRVDRIAAICTRLFLHVTAEKYKPKPEHSANFAEFLLHDDIPNDLRASVMLDLTKHSTAVTKELLKDKRLAKLLLEKM
jgi:hypothetical protein